MSVFLVEDIDCVVLVSDVVLVVLVSADVLLPWQDTDLVLLPSIRLCTAPLLPQSGILLFLLGSVFSSEDSADEVTEDATEREPLGANLW